MLFQADRVVVDHRTLDHIIDEGGKTGIEIRFVLLDALKVDPFRIFSTCAAIRSSSAAAASWLPCRSSRAAWRVAASVIASTASSTRSFSKRNSLAGSKQDGVDLILRPLGDRLKPADRVDFVVKEVDRKRLFDGDGKDIENAPAHTKLAGGLDLAHPLVTHLLRRSRPLGEIQPLAHPDLQPVTGKHFGRHQLGRHGLNRCDHDDRIARGQVQEGRHALLLHLGVGENLFVGVSLGVGKYKNTLFREQGRKVLVPLLGLILGGGEDDGREMPPARGIVRQGGDVKAFL